MIADARAPLTLLSSEAGDKPLSAFAARPPRCAARLCLSGQHAFNLVEAMPRRRRRSLRVIKGKMSAGKPEAFRTSVRHSRNGEVGEAATVNPPDQTLVGALVAPSKERK
jgi:hypothetical protein